MNHRKLLLHVNIGNDNQERISHKMYCLQNTTMTEVIFDKAEVDGMLQWHIETKQGWQRHIRSNATIWADMFNSDTSRIVDGYEQTNKLYEFTQMPGVHYPRIFRPIFHIDWEQFFVKTETLERMDRRIRNVRDFIPIDYEVMLTGVTQLSVIIEQLKQICRTVHPGTNNLEVYGNEIRNLLILTCTEVEAQWVGILKANSILKERYSTADYVALLPIMKLKNYCLLYNLYPWLDNFRPFSNWDPSMPTKSLFWYDAYNAVKHNREEEFKKATLQNLLYAISALYLLLNAQYGNHITYWPDLIGNFFRISDRPSWELDEYYLPPWKSEKWNTEPFFNKTSYV